MRRIILHAAFLTVSMASLPHHVSGQPPADSLFRLPIHTIADSTRVQALLSAAAKNMYRNARYSLPLAMYALEGAVNTRYTRGMINAQMMLAEAFALTGNFSEGLDLALKSVKEAEKRSDQRVLSIMYMKCGVIYGIIGDYASSIAYYRKSLDHFDGPDSTKGAWFGLLGEAFIRENNLDSAFYYSNRAYEVYITQQEHWGQVYINLGNVHTRYRHFPLALDFFNTALSSRTVALDSIEASIGIANIFVETGQWDSVLLYTRQAIRLAKEKGYPSYLVTAYGLLTDKFDAEARYDSAYVYQRLMLDTKDSIFANEKMSRLENIRFTDQLRQIELRAASAQAAASRKINLQFALVGIGLVTFLILFLTLSNTFVVSTRFVRVTGIIALLLVFEFINLYIHPFVGALTDHSPFAMLLIMVCIAALLAPLHTRLEQWIQHQLVEKNRRTRIAAAKKILGENQHVR